MPTKARVGLDCRLSGITQGGIGRYEVELFSRVLGTDAFQWIVFLRSKDQQAALSSRLSSKQQSAIEWIVASINHYSAKEQLRLPSVFSSQNLDILHVPHFNVPLLYRGKTIITIHDLLWHHQKGNQVTTLPAWQYWFKYVGYRAVVKSAVRRAQAIIVPSETIKQHVLKQEPAVTNRVTVTYEGVDTSFRPTTTPRDMQHLLYVGSLYPHKNVQLVLQALKQLPDWRLTILSARSVFTDAFQHSITDGDMSKQVELKVGCSDSELRKLYHTATAVIQPSLSEGFGLTGIEALACHTPLIASNIPIFNEIYQDQAIYFDPQSVDSLVEVLHNFSSYKPNWKSTNLLLQRYDWDKTAKQTLAVYIKALEPTEKSVAGIQ